MTAAVADYRPADAHAGKRTKDARGLAHRAGADHRHPRPSSASCGGARGRCWSGSPPSTETGAVERARAKLERKRVDMIVVNDISRRDIGFDVDHNEIVLVTASRVTDGLAPIQA